MLSSQTVENIYQDVMDVGLEALIQIQPKFMLLLQMVTHGLYGHQFKSQMENGLSNQITESFWLDVMDVLEEELILISLLFIKVTQIMLGLNGQ